MRGKTEEEQVVDCCAVYDTMNIPNETVLESLIRRSSISNYSFYKMGFNLK